MITLLASLIGFISSLIPEIMKFFLDKNDKKHELHLLEQQLKMRKMGYNSADEVITENNYREIQALYKTYRTGICWVDALNGTVRPVLAYSFFAIYTFIKYLQYKVIAASVSLSEIVNLLWSVDDQAIFAGIISFYFGQRALSKLRGK
jgi:hypothetical protein